MGTAQLQCATDSRPLAICGFTDAAQGPAHRWWVAGMEGGSNHCALLPGNTCQEAHRQNQVLSSVLANEVRRPLRLYGPVRPHSNPISIPNSYVPHELCVHASFYLYSLSSLGQDRILWDAMQGTEWVLNLCVPTTRWYNVVA